MLKGIDHRLNADVLYVLRSMGHGDTLIISDVNFPSKSIAKETVHGDLLRMENITSPDAIKAILTVLPLDTFVEDFAGRMQVVGSPDIIPPVQEEVMAAIAVEEGPSRQMVSIERFAFYELARQAYAVIQTGEQRLFGCFMLRKGIVELES